MATSIRDDVSVESVLAELKSKGNEKTRVTYSRHGHPVERTFGVSIADLKVILKGIKGQQELGYQLYETGYLDAMYLAGMVVDGSKMDRERLRAWAVGAVGMPMISEYTVPWVAVESPFGRELALEWIRSAEENVAASGWCTYSGLVATKADEALDLAEIQSLLERVVLESGAAQNRVRHMMNMFLISVGAYVRPLLSQSKEAAVRLGTVSVDMGDTACKVPSALGYIEKIEAMGRVGKKRKTMRC